MRTEKPLLLTGLVLVLAASSSAQQPADLPIAKLVAQVGGALARVEFKIENPLMSVQQDGGLAVCVNAGDGIFVNRDVPGQVPTDELKDFKVVTSGVNQKRFDADLLGIDPETGLAFLQIYVKSAEGKRTKAQHPWTELKFEPKANLQLGQRVVSVGLLGPQTGNTPYVGVAIVSALLRLPGEIAYVSGDLTNSCSPVLSGDGKIIGMVGGQVPTEYRMLLAGRWADVGLVGRQRTTFFVTADDFAHVLAAPPAPGNIRKLPWLGVLNFLPLNPESPEADQLKGKPAVIVGQVIEEGPAFQAGLRQSDAITAINGAALEELAAPELTAANFDRTIARMKPGQKVTLSIIRGGKGSDLEVTLGTMPTRPFEAGRHYDKALGLGARDLVTLDRYAGRDKPLKESGAVITMVKDNSPAAKGQLRPGDLATAVNKKATPTAADLGKAIEAALKAAPGKEIEFMIVRGSLVQSVLVKPE